MLNLDAQWSFWGKGALVKVQRVFSISKGLSWLEEALALFQDIWDIILKPESPCLRRLSSMTCLRVRLPNPCSRVSMVGAVAYLVSAGPLEGLESRVSQEGSGPCLPDHPSPRTLDIKVGMSPLVGNTPCVWHRLFGGEISAAPRICGEMSSHSSILGFLRPWAMRPLPLLNWVTVHFSKVMSLWI